MNLIETTIVVWAFLTYLTMVHSSGTSDENKSFILLLFQGLGWSIYWGMYLWGKKFGVK